MPQHVSWPRLLRRAPGDFEGDGAHLFVDKTVGRENDGITKLVRLSGEIGHFAAGFFDQQNARGSVPFREAEFPEASEAASRGRGEIERGGPITAHTVRALGKVAVVAKIGAGLAIAHRKPGAQQTGRERGIWGNVDFLAVERGAFAARGGEKFVVKRIEDRGGEQRIPLGKSDRDAKAGISMSEVRGAVKRINVPAKFGSRSALMPRALFGSNSVVGKVLSEALDDEALRTLVRLSDEIDFVAFVANVKRARQFFNQDFPGVLRNFNGGFKIGIVHADNTTVAGNKNRETN